MFSLFTGIFGKIFSDWRLIAMAVLIAVCGYMTIRLKVEQVHLQKAQEVIKVVETNNVVLKQNVATITKVNQENVKMLEQLKADSVMTAKTVAQLNNTLSARDRTVADMKRKLNGLGTPVSKPTPYIDLAVKGMQQLRNEASTTEGGSK
jgi:hypothetical protein